MWKKIRPTKDFVILRIDLKVKFGRKMRGTDTARFRLEESIGSAFLHEFFERGEFFIGSTCNMT